MSHKDPAKKYILVSHKTFNFSYNVYNQFEFCLVQNRNEYLALSQLTIRRPILSLIGNNPNINTTIIFRSLWNETEIRFSDNSWAQIKLVFFLGELPRN